MATDQLEREDKYDVPHDFVLPDLADVFPGSDVTARTFQLKATYYDTAEDHLRRHGITLRRRRGGYDAGGHAKLPAASARLEVMVDSEASSTPAELTALLVGARRGRRGTRTNWPNRSSAKQPLPPSRRQSNYRRCSASTKTAW